MLREKRKWKPHKRESTEAKHRDGSSSSSVEGPVMGLERRGWIDRLYDVVNQRMGGAIE